MSYKKPDFSYDWKRFLSLNCFKSFYCLKMFHFFSVVHRPDLSEREDILKYFVKVWNEFFAKTEDLFKNLLCPRNIMLMRQSDNNELVWSNLAKLVAFLIKANVLSSDNFEFQCTAFYQKEWDQVNHFLFIILY